MPFPFYIHVVSKSFLDTLNSVKKCFIDPLSVLFEVALGEIGLAKIQGAFFPPEAKLAKMLDSLGKAYGHGER